MELPAHLTPVERRRIRKATARGGQCALCGATATNAVLWKSKQHPEWDGHVYLLCWDCNRRDQQVVLDVLTAKRDAQKDADHAELDNHLLR